MGQTTNKKQWRLEVNDPRKSDDWHPLWRFEEGQYVSYEELAEDLSYINGPIQVRLAPDTD